MLTFNQLFVILSVIMKYLIQDITKIKKVNNSLKGVFSISDLSILLQTDGQQLYNRLNYLLKNKIIKKATRGFYTTDDFNIECLATRNNPESYVSGPTVLAESLVIGTVPEYELSCVKTGRSREYQLGNYRINYSSIKPSMFFGYEFIDGIKKAFPEKALIDCLYYYQSGKKYYFNIFDDVNIDVLDKERFYSYLKRYKNPKFREFVYGYYTARDKK